MPADRAAVMGQLIERIDCDGFQGKVTIALRRQEQ